MSVAQCAHRALPLHLAHLHQQHAGASFGATSLPSVAQRFKVAHVRCTTCAAYSAARAVQGLVTPPDTVDAESHRRVLASRNRLTERFNETNAYVDHLESRVEESSSDFEAAADFVHRWSSECSSTLSMGESCSAALRFGLDPREAADRMAQLCERLRVMAQLQFAVHQAVQAQQSILSKRVLRRVPIAWSGLANEVRLMGDFDGWTRGCTLSTSEDGPDGGIQTFEAEVLLLPGEHLVKFLVDGKWRLASEWPTRTSAAGDTNNVLMVT